MLSRILTRLTEMELAAATPEEKNLAWASYLIVFELFIDEIMTDMEEVLV